MPASLQPFGAKRVQNHCRQHLNALLLGEYLTDPEDHARKTDDLENLNIKYVLTNGQWPQCQLHRQYALGCLLAAGACAPSESHLHCSVLDVLILQCFLHACINCSVSDQLFSVQDWYSSLKSAQEKHPIRWGVGRIDQTNMTMKPTVAQPVSINADGNNLGVQQES